MPHVIAAEAFPIVECAYHNRVSAKFLRTVLLLLCELPTNYMKLIISGMILRHAYNLYFGKERE